MANTVTLGVIAPFQAAVLHNQKVIIGKENAVPSCVIRAAGPRWKIIVQGYLYTFANTLAALNMVKRLGLSEKVNQ